MSFRTYTEHCVEHKHDDTPEGFEVIKSYVPHSCPWDCYGRDWQQEREKVLAAAGIKCELLQDRQRNLTAIGSGSGGRFRFGDDWLPGVFYLAVKIADKGAAMRALSEHKDAIIRWLHEDGPIPEACKP